MYIPQSDHISNGDFNAGYSGDCSCFRPGLIQVGKTLPRGRSYLVQSHTPLTAVVYVGLEMTTIGVSIGGEAAFKGFDSALAVARQKNRSSPSLYLNTEYDSICTSSMFIVVVVCRM